MRTSNEYIAIIKSFADVLRTRFGVSSLKLFGSVARNEQTANSDLDVCVVMNPDIILHVRLKRFLEEKLGCDVDVVRIHKNMNEILRKEIDRDGIEVFA